MPHTVQLSPTLSSYESEDEVVWSFSDSSVSFSALSSSAGAGTASKDAENDSSDDDDFVLLPRPRSAKAIRRWSDLVSDSELNISQSKVVGEATTTTTIITAGHVDTSQNGSTSVPSAADVQKTPRTKVDMQLQPLAEAQGRPTPSVSVKKKKKAAKVPSPPSPVGPKPRRCKKIQKQQPAPAADSVKTAAATSPAAGERSKADGKSSRKQRKKAPKSATPPRKNVPTAVEIPPEMFSEASLFITSFLANPVAKRDSVCRLTLLQSLIVEFGLAATGLPTSLRSARAFLKARVFINIREYLADRAEGQAAIRRLLHPSRAALIKDIRRKGHTAPCKWVKEQGLEVLLVSCYYH